MVAECMEDMEVESGEFAMIAPFGALGCAALP